MLKKSSKSFEELEEQFEGEDARLCQAPAPSPIDNGDQYALEVISDNADPEQTRALARAQTVANMQYFGSLAHYQELTSDSDINEHRHVTELALMGKEAFSSLAKSIKSGSTEDQHVGSLARGAASLLTATVVSFTQANYLRNRKSGWGTRNGEKPSHSMDGYRPKSRVRKKKSVVKDVG